MRKFIRIIKQKRSCDKIILTAMNRMIKLNELEITTLINMLSVAAAKELDEKELAFVAAALTQMGSVLETIAAIKYTDK